MSEKSISEKALKGTMDPERPLNILDTTEAQRKEILNFASDVRKFEIGNFWQRSLFFWGFIGAAFVAFAQTYQKQPFVGTLVACFGLVSSMAWTLGNRGSKYWQEAWERKVKAVEISVLGAALFSNREPIQKKGMWGAGDYSVSRLAIALSDFTVFIWLVFIFMAAYRYATYNDRDLSWFCLCMWRLVALIFPIVISIALLGLMFCKAGPRRLR